MNVYKALKTLQFNFCVFFHDVFMYCEKNHLKKKDGNIYFVGPKDRD